MNLAAAMTCLGIVLGCAVFADPPARAERGAHPVPDPKPETEAIPEKYADQKEISILLEKLEQQEAFLGMQITMRIINPTDKAMVYRGAYASSPQIRRQHWVNGKWKEAGQQEAELIKPGIHARDISIPPGESVVFVMGVAAEQMPMRVGLDYTSQGKAQFTVWSDKIER